MDIPAWIRSHLVQIVVWTVLVFVIVLMGLYRWPAGSRPQIVLWLAVGAAIVIVAAIIYSALEPPGILPWIRSHKWHLIPWALVGIAAIVLLLLCWPPANTTQMILWLAMGGAIVVIAAIIYSAIEPPSSGDEPMPRAKRIFLMAYLMVIGAALVLMLFSLASLDFPETPLQPQEAAVTTATPTATPAQTPAPPAGPTPAPRPAQPTPAATPVVPIVLRVFSETAGEPPTQYLTVYGRNFKKDRSKIRFNSTEGATDFITDNLLKRSLNAADIEGRGAVTVDVMTENDDESDGPVSNALVVPIEKPRVTLNILFFWRALVTKEMQLLLLVICAGALGSYLHAIMSIADFIGGRKLKVSWFWWYLTRPFLGMAMGLIFYAMLRGGFLVGTPADEKFVNPFGVIAIGALVGMFSDKAAQKLGEVFDVVFRAATPRPDKLEETIPVITQLDPPKLPAGSEETVVNISGEHLTTVATVKVNEDARVPDKVSEKIVSFKLTKADLETPSTIKITVVDADGDVSAASSFEVTEAKP